jgi:L-ascorbate metabolism protein UlaG (beta-lactamase superfamily)
MENIKWFGHASFYFVDRRSGNRIYYVDPFELPDIELEPADLVFITHAHPDHFSPKDLEMIMHDETTIIAPPEILLQIDRDDKLKQGVMPNNSYEVKGFKFSTIPAYNDRPGREEKHPRANNWVGYIFELNGQKIYHAGDTDFTPEMKGLKDLSLDVAMLPIGGNFTMDVDEAIEAANHIGAKTTIPMHYRKLLGNKYKEAEEKFKSGVTNSQVVILEQVS